MNIFQTTIYHTKHYNLPLKFQRYPPILGNGSSKAFTFALPDSEHCFYVTGTLERPNSTSRCLSEHCLGSIRIKIWHKEINVCVCLEIVLAAGISVPLELCISPPEKIRETNHHGMSHTLSYKGEAERGK